MADSDEFYELDFNDLTSIKCSEFGQKIEFKEDEIDLIEYEIPSLKTMNYAEGVAFFEPCFRSLSFDDFYFILVSMMLEKTVILVSKSLQRLSSSM